MKNQSKIVKITCAPCEKLFLVPFSLEDENADGDGDVSTNCMYCRKPVMVTIPRKYIKKPMLVMG